MNGAVSTTGRGTVARKEETITNELVFGFKVKSAGPLTVSLGVPECSFMMMKSVEAK